MSHQHAVWKDEESEESDDGDNGDASAESQTHENKGKNFSIVALNLELFRH